MGSSPPYALEPFGAMLGPGAVQVKSLRASVPRLAQLQFPPISWSGSVRCGVTPVVGVGPLKPERQLGALRGAGDMTLGSGLASRISEALGELFDGCRRCPSPRTLFAAELSSVLGPRLLAPPGPGKDRGGAGSVARSLEEKEGGCQACRSVAFPSLSLWFRI